jgi:hypothetical protein
MSRDAPHKWNASIYGNALTGTVDAGPHIVDVLRASQRAGRMAAILRDLAFPKTACSGGRHDISHGLSPVTYFCHFEETTLPPRPPPHLHRTANRLLSCNIGIWRHIVYLCGLDESFTHVILV